MLTIRLHFLRNKFFWGSSKSFSSEENSSVEEEPLSQLPNYVSIFTPASTYNLRSKSYQNDEIIELEDTSAEATSFPKQTR